MVFALAGDSTTTTFMKRPATLVGNHGENGGRPVRRREGRDKWHRKVASSTGSVRRACGKGPLPTLPRKRERARSSLSRETGEGRGGGVAASPPRCILRRGDAGDV